MTKARTEKLSHREGRIVHDADSHITEMDGWLESYSSQYVKKNLNEGLVPLSAPMFQPYLEAARERIAGNNPELTEGLKENIFGHKGKMNQWAAFGAVKSIERSDALNIMGIQSQLVFPLAGLSRFALSDDLKLVYEGSEALN